MQTLQSLQFIQKLEQPDQATLLEKQVFLPEPKDPSITKTIVFDLDETLIHCMEQPYQDEQEALKFLEEKCDHIINFQFPNGEVV